MNNSELNLTVEKGFIEKLVYEIDGFAPAEDQGWGTSYNFGTRDAVMLRWKAAIAAGVNLIASDQYEDLAALIQSSMAFLDTDGVYGATAERTRAAKHRLAAAVEEFAAFQDDLRNRDAPLIRRVK